MGRQTDGLTRPSHAPGLQAACALVEDRRFRERLPHPYLEEGTQNNIGSSPHDGTSPL